MLVVTVLVSQRSHPQRDTSAAPFWSWEVKVTATTLSRNWDLRANAILEDGGA